MPDQQDFDMNEVLARDKAARAQSFDMNAVLARDADASRSSTDPGSYLMRLADIAGQGLLQTPGYQPPPGFVNQAAYAAGKYGPVAGGATIGSLFAPGAGTALGAGIAAGAGAAMGRSLQNLAQTGANQILPGSAAEKSNLQLAGEPVLEGLGQGLGAGITTKAVNALKSPAISYVAGSIGVKPNLVKQAFDNIGRIFSSPSVEQAGQEIGNLAAKAGLKTGTEGYKLATASMLGAKNATDEFSTAVTLKMAKLAREVPDALTPQEMYSTAEGLRAAFKAPKYADPHGPFSQNFGMYAKQLSNLEDRLETEIPGYTAKRMGYVRALAKEAFSSLTPLNKNMSPSILRTMAMTPQAIQGALGLGGAYEAGKGDLEPAGWLLSAALLSPLLTGRMIQATSLAASSQIPQLLGRAGIAAGTEALGPK